MKLVLDTHIYCDYAEGLADVVEAMPNMGNSFSSPRSFLAN